MNSVDSIHAKLKRKLDLVHLSVHEVVDQTFDSLRVLTTEGDSPVYFPEEEPLTVRTESGTVRLEAIAYAMFRYCWYICSIEGRNEISFAELGEKIYNDPCKPRSTIQNAIRRGRPVESIGITYFYSGEKAFLQYQRR